MEAFFGPWDLGKLLSDTFNIYFKNWIYYIAIVAPFAIIGALIAWGLSFAVGGTTVIPGFAYPNNWSFFNLFAILGFGLLGVLIAIVVNVLMNNAMINVVGQQYFTDKISVGKAFSAGVKKIVTVLLAGLLRGILLALMAITIVGIPFAIYYMVKWIFVTHVILFEGKGVTESLSRSSEITRGNWWRIVGYAIVFIIITAIISGILGRIPVVGGAIGTIITMPITVISTTLIYFTLRVEKEQYSTAQLKVDIDAWDSNTKPVYLGAAAPEASQAPADSSDAAFCSSCGAKRSGDAQYCTKCGASFKPDAASTQPAEPENKAFKPKNDSFDNNGPFIK